MGYSLHIEMPDGETLDLEHWLEAVDATDGCRAAGSSGHPPPLNPLTGEVIAISGTKGDVEIYDPDSDAWHAVLHWSEGKGRASMSSRAVAIVGGDLVGPIGETVKRLAAHLGAQIRGDEGELYPV